MEELTTWHASLPEADRLLIRECLAEKSPDDLLYSLRGYLESMPGTPEEKSPQLAAVFTALAVNPLGGGPGLEPDEDYLSIEGTTPAEFLKLEAPLTSARPNDVWLAVAFLRTHAATGAWGTVLERTAAALTKIKPERDTAYAPFLEFRTLALEHFGRGAEAVTEIRALPTLPEGQSTSEAVALSRAAQARLVKRIEKAE